jgi:hypothetical protein
LDSINAAVRDIEAQECAAFDVAGCKAAEPVCGDSAIEIACVDHVCTRSNPEVLADCVVCMEQAVEWEVDADGGRSVSRVEPCARYQRQLSSADGDEYVCNAQVVACGPNASSGAISTALAHPDVQALATRNVNPIRFGDTRGDTFKIRIGVRELVLGGSCDGVPSGCIPVPPGVEALRELLPKIDQSMIATGACLDAEM